MPDHSLPTTPDLAAAVTARPRRRARWGRAVALLVVLAATGAGAWAWVHRPAAPPVPTSVEVPPALTVAVLPVREEALRRPALGDGSVVPWQELVVGAETSGLRVTEVAFEEGDAVRRGQALVRLDATLLVAGSAAAEAALAEAEAALRIAQSDLRRSAELARSESVARQILEQREATARQAEARLLSARARRDEAAARLAQATVAAPADGVISRRAVLPGAVVQPGQELFRLIRDDRLELDARVPELDLPGIVPGAPARVIHGEREIPATVRLVAPTVDAATRLGTVRVALPPGSGLRPGVFARAEITPAAPRPVLVVPGEAVVFREGAPVAFVVPEGSDQVAQRRLMTGMRRGGLVEVREGLSGGERVVVTGAGFLTDGDRVRVAPR